ncbi:MAG TPA: hypothetical protein VHX38_29020 [Pseudonocardiaceae bacterium]|nr:hypothetical protein [Pseudonocardiaceae bacterium]
MVAQWLRYATANRSLSDLRLKDGDYFGAELALGRSEVRRAAAKMLAEAQDPLEAAKRMHEQARLHWQHDLPLIGFDEAAVRYTRTRTWQDCARAIDPSLPVVQPLLEWD